MEIRKATKADLDAVENSYRELLPNSSPEENYSGWILDVYPNRKWAEENGIVRGDDGGNKHYLSFVTKEEAVALIHRSAEVVENAVTDGNK